VAGAFATVVAAGELATVVPGACCVIVVPATALPDGCCPVVVPATVLPDGCPVDVMGEALITVAPATLLPAWGDGLLAAAIACCRYC
jgi:hypothetical protein